MHQHSGAPEPKRNRRITRRIFPLLVRKIVWERDYPHPCTANSFTKGIILIPLTLTLTTNSPFQLSIDLVTESHDELPVLIFISGVCGLLCKNTTGKPRIKPKLTALPCSPEYHSIHKRAQRQRKTAPYLTVLQESRPSSLPVTWLQAGLGAPPTFCAPIRVACHGSQQDCQETSAEYSEWKE